MLVQLSRQMSFPSLQLPPQGAKNSHLLLVMAHFLSFIPDESRPTIMLHSLVIYLYRVVVMFRLDSAESFAQHVEAVLKRWNYRVVDREKASVISQAETLTNGN